ncbi:MAG: tetratricopeptide repeat protein [Melioribacteraceae bacterium]|nr:tetratricopeptide repeat protein [Melioribacteraceae bacterium]
MKKLIFFLLISLVSIAQSNFDKANKLILKNNFAEAAKILENFTHENENADAYLKLGICYKNLMLHTEALKAIERANELDTNNVDILTNLASLYSTNGFDKSAIGTYQKVIQLDSTNLFAKINLAKLYVDSGKWNAAKSIYLDLAKYDSRNSFYYRQLGYVFQKENKLDDAYHYYKTAYALNPQDHFTISNLAKVYFQKEQSDSAIAIIDKGLETFENNTQFLKLKSDIYFSLKNYPGAVNAIVRLIANGDESAQLYQRLGICYYQIAVENFVGEAQIQKLGSAIETLNKSSAIDSTQSLTELYLGLTYKELEKMKKQLIICKKQLS